MKEITRETLDFLERISGWKMGPGTKAVLIPGGGSDRSFFRVMDGERSAIVLAQPRLPAELDSYVAIARFLHHLGIDVPEIYGFDRERGILLMEDLGDLHLEDALRGASRQEELSLYRQCVEILARLQTSVTEAMNRTGILSDRVFTTHELLRETEYFREEFIEGFCPVTMPVSWEEERQLLAMTLAEQQPVFMHRDFQSRNILIKDERMRIVDFQTAHRGPGLYDAASLLKDPYHPLAPDARRSLIEELYAELKDRGAHEVCGFTSFYETFIIAGIQRNLQALAAFAKLGLKKGKRRFLESIPNGLASLEEGVREAARFPGLAMMVAQIKAKLESALRKASGTR
jgi:aminoglycoside/choline kinase family phosphotransferase